MKAILTTKNERLETTDLDELELLTSRLEREGVSFDLQFEKGK